MIIGTWAAATAALRFTELARNREEKEHQQEHLVDIHQANLLIVFHKNNHFSMIIIAN